MSEKFYQLLLRFYPSHFVRQYGDEAMQVFRDRLRDERGFLKRARLWLDLLLDLTLSAPREHRRAPSAPSPSPSGFPSFLVLEEAPLAPNRFLCGTLLALIVVGSFVFLLNHGGNRVLLPGISNQRLRSEVTPGPSSSVQGKPSPANPDDTPAPMPPLTTAERRLVIRQVIHAIGEFAPHSAELKEVTALLQENESRGDYEQILYGPLFARMLTRQIDSVTKDVRVTVLCGQQPGPDSRIWILPSRPGSPLFERIDNHFSVALRPGKNQ